MQRKRKLLLVSATDFEILPLIDYLKNNFENKSSVFLSDQLEIHLLISGVGMVPTTFALASFLASQDIDIAFNFGIAGAFNRAFKIGDVFQVSSDCFADMGVETAAGEFQDLFQLQLIDENEPPFVHKKLYSPASNADFLPKASSLTVNKVSGTEKNIAGLEGQYPVDLETMEGAAFYYCCNMHQVEALQIRAVSNYVEPRNKNNWDIPLAIETLNKVAIEMLETLKQADA